AGLFCVWAPPVLLARPICLATVHRARCGSSPSHHQNATRLMQLSCPACAQPTEHRLLYSKNGCDILRCPPCGLGRAPAGGFDPGSSYTDDYFSGGHADGYADYRGAEPVLRREFAGTVDFIRRHRDSGRLLDVGCAYGFFLQEAKRAFDVSGIEIAADAAA